MTYRVAIVEDDPMILLLDRNFVELDSRFTVVQEMRDGRAALQWLRTNPVDLLILEA